MTHQRGARVADYRAPLFLAWQLTNRCGFRCLHCCEDSGPARAWPGELSAAEAVGIARQTAELGIPYVAFGGGEPMEVPHVWDIFETLRRGRVEIKIETNGLAIDEDAAARLKNLAVASVQISVDGPTAAQHESVRPEGDFEGALAVVRRLARLGLEPEVVFVPTRLNIAGAVETMDLAASAGARTFVTGPLMRLGRAALAWESLAPAPSAWAETARRLTERAKKYRDSMNLSLYPWDIQEEIRVRMQEPQAMVLVVPDGKVKLLNALPFAPADLKKDSLQAAWEAVKKAWKDPRVLDFSRRAAQDPALLVHANECWSLDALHLTKSRTPAI